VKAEMIAITVRDIAFFFILCMIDDVKTTSVIFTRPCLICFSVLKISDTELLKNKKAPTIVKKSMLKGVIKAVVKALKTPNISVDI
jgi:hypothetical protein